MIGITAFGGYVPRLRISRKTILASLDHPSPDISPKTSGERSVCNFDEDTLTMAHEAARACLPGGASDVDTVHLCSTTLPFADRQNAGILKTALGLPDRLASADFTGSLRAGTTGLLAAVNAVKAGAANTVLVAAADHRLAGPGSPDELLHGDAAAAVVIGASNPIAELVGSVSITRDTPDHYRRFDQATDYHWEDRWALDQAVIPAATEAFHALLESVSVRTEDIAHVILPSPSAAAHKRLVRALGIPADRVAPPLLDVIGDTGTAHPLLLLAHVLETAAPGETIVCVGLGSGADALCFRIPQSKSAPAVPPFVSRSIEAKERLEGYAKFLSFRGALTPDRGVRGEIQTKTALSVVYREREMILGLTGGRCTACGTRQFPKTRMCVHPGCRQADTQAPYSFADETGRLRTYTGDFLLPSPDPPSLYGLLQFDGGGRMHTEITDCTLEELTAGMRMRMVFRKRYEDAQRGFVGYFWKATPLREGGETP